MVTIKKDIIEGNKGTNVGGELNVIWDYHSLIGAEIYGYIDGERLTLHLTGRYFLKERQVWVVLEKGIVISIENKQSLSKNWSFNTSEF